MAAETIAVVGAGAWGTALALVAARAGRPVVLWGRDGWAMADVAARHENARFLPGAALPPEIEPTADVSRLAGARTVLVAVPTQALREVSAALAPAIRADAVLVSCAKGIERTTGHLGTAVLAEALPGRRAAVLSGPSFATDVARGLPTAVTIAADDMALAERLCRRLAGPGFRPYASDDPVGVQVGGALKNVLAIAAGITSGLDLGASAEAALIARGFAEMRRSAVVYGARPETLMGLSGLGDLVLTCRSVQSRNFAYGISVGRGGPLDPRGKTVEGIATAGIAAERAKAADIEAPITESVAAVVAGRLAVAEALAMLLARPLKREEA